MNIPIWKIKKFLEINLSLITKNTDLIQQLKDKESIQIIQDIKESFTPIGTIVRDDTEINPLENKQKTKDDTTQNLEIYSNPTEEEN